MMNYRECAAYNLMKIRLDKGLTVSDLSKKIGYSHTTIRKIETGKISPTLDYLESFANGLEMWSMGELFNVLGYEDFAYEAKCIAKAVDNMRNSMKKCEQQKQYILDAIKKNGYSTVTDFCRKQNLPIKTPYNFLARNDGTVCALRDLTLYQYVHMLHMDYDEKEGIWK